MATVKVDTLLAEARWLRRLALSLVRDPAEADDIEQETWAAALAARPDPDRPLRPWLKTVLLNVIRMRHRAGGRRRAREDEFEVARDAPPDPAQLLERAELERRLAGLVVALDEPYRSTVLLRYQEGLGAEQIAAMHGVPAGTVRWRLKTALDRLRGQMDDQGPRWRAVLAAPPLGRLIVAKKTTALMWALLLLLLAGGGLWLAHRARGHEDQRARAARSAAAGGGHMRAATAGDGAAGLAQRLFAQPGLAPRRIAGRVLAGAAPVAGAHVQLSLADTGAPLAEAVSGVDGHFDLGVQLAAAYLATASAPGAAGKPLRVDLREPGREPPSDRLELVLTPCDPLSGRVLDGSGGVVAGARVRPAAGGWPEVESDERGGYRICLPSGPTTLAFGADGYASLLVELDVDGPRMQDVVLIPESIVEGTVVAGEDGHPLAGALVRVEPNERGTEVGAAATAVSDASGHFSVGGIAAGRSRITAVADGRITASPVEIVTEAGQTLAGVVVPADRAGRLTGRVVLDGKPLAGARLRVTVGSMLQSEEAQAVSQQDGRFTIERVRRGALAVHVEDHEVVSPRGFQLAEEGDTDVTIEVRALGAIRGRVLRRGAPVAGAEVSCAPGRMTGADGRYDCRGLDPGAHRLIAIDTRTWGPQAGGLVVELARGESRAIDLELAFSASVCGDVVDQDGAPVAGVEVSVVLAAPADEGHGQTGADGRFCARRLLGGGSYRAAVFLPGGRVHPFAAATAFPEVAVPGADSQVTGVHLVVERHARAIAGRVVDARGAPVADARVAAWLDRAGGPPPLFLPFVAVPTATTDEDGGFRIDGLPGAGYALLARGRDGGEAMVRGVAAGARGVRITLDASGAIEGRLVGFASPPPVIAVIADYHLHPIDAQVTGDRFHLRAVPAGAYVLTAANGRQQDSTTVIVRPGQVASVTMSARGAAAIAGRVVERTRGTPVAGLRCSAVPRAGAQIGVFYSQPDVGVVTDEGGRFAIDPAPAGEVLIHCSGNAATSHGGLAVELTAGQRVAVEVPVVARSGQEGTIGAMLRWITLEVMALTSGGPAETAGLALGDVVTAVDGVPTDGLSNEAAMLLITQRPVGERARVTVRRGGALRVLSIPVAAGED